MIKSIFLVAALVGSVLASVDYIELNDHNNNLLPLDVSKALKTVQDALKNEFRFRSVKDTIKFVDRCKFLKKELKDTADDQYEGLAGKIKALLQDEQLKQTCSVHRGQLGREFSALDEEDMGINVSRKRVERLVEIRDKLEANPSIKILLNHLFEKIENSMASSLLSNAAKDTSTFFGESTEKGFFSLPSLGDTYKSGCSISTLKPLCKLVRKSNLADVTALGSDVADFKQAYEAKDQATLDKHVQMSGVSLDDLKSSCEETKSNWHAFKLLDAHKAANFIEDAKIDEQCKVDPDFYFYYEMFRLCQLV